MAPFKLKFRMGSSRSISQEHDPDPQVNEALLDPQRQRSAAIGASSSTIDSADCTSLGSLGTSERKSLLPHKSNNLRLGYINPNLAQSVTSGSSATDATLPQTPPPSYEYVLEEKTRLVSSFDLCTPPPTQRKTATPDKASQRSRSNPSIIHLSSVEELSQCCTDPDCVDNFINEKHLPATREQHSRSNVARKQRLQRQQEIENNESPLKDAASTEIVGDDNHTETFNSSDHFALTNMATSSQADCQSGGVCQCAAHYCECSGGGEENSASGNSCDNDFRDPLTNHREWCTNDSRCYSTTESQYENDCSDSDNGGEGWNNSQMSSKCQRREQNQSQQQHEYEQQQQQYQQQKQQQRQQQHQQQHAQYHQQQQQRTTQQAQRSPTTEIISNKSSKEIYKDLAKQWGITCKMSDGCRCMECQSHYFDCEYDDNEHQKSDGGLGAGTPMFISEVMHGTACNIL